MLQRIPNTTSDYEDASVTLRRKSKVGPPSPTIQRLLELQRQVGNQNVATLVRAPSVPMPGITTPPALSVQRAELDVDYTVSGHGWDRINQRGITQTQLERTLDDPTVVHDDGDTHIYVSVFSGGERCIRAIMSKDHPMKVITVMKVTGKKKVARYVDRP